MFHDSKDIKDLMRNAITSGNVHILKFLLENGYFETDIKEAQKFPFFYAVTHRNLEMVKCLIENGAAPIFHHREQE